MVFTSLANFFTLFCLLLTSFPASTHIWASPTFSALDPHYVWLYLSYFTVPEPQVWGRRNFVGKGVAKIIDDTYRWLSHLPSPIFPYCFKSNTSNSKLLQCVVLWYVPCRKMQIPGATDLASKSYSSTEFNHMKPKEVDSYKSEMKIRCPCGKSSNSESMIQVVLLLQIQCF